MVASEIIKNIRTKLNITQEELAHSIHVTYHTVNRWENNKSNPNRMARALLSDFCQRQGIEQKLIDEINQLR